MTRRPYHELLEKYNLLKEEIRYFQEYDAITNLINKNTFYNKTQALLQENTHDDFFIFCVDVERFKVINDLFGTQKGNDVLLYLASNLQTKAFIEGSLLSRLSADVFVACTKQSNVNDIIETIISIFKEIPLSMEINPAIGVYPIVDKNIHIETMCDRAILALNTIKGNYQKHYAIYDDHMWTSLLEEQEIRSQANLALQNQEFQIYMQPKCNMNSNKIMGAEALVRWVHPKKGLISPNSFIPIFEKNGFIKKLDAYVWEEVIKWLHEREVKGLLNVPISVNVSRIDILGLNVPLMIKDMLHKYQIDPALLQLEITESAYTKQLKEMVSTIESLMASGHVILMDDFGSGYSSLNMLKDINVDILKLDLRFLDSTNNKSKDIIESIIHMAKWLNLKVIAEGIETKEQERFLLSIGCIYAQGYLYYKPMPLPAFEELLNTTQSIEFETVETQHEIQENLIKFKDLFHADMMSEQLLNNILGAIALYQFEDQTLKIIRCNQEYLTLTHQDPQLIYQENYNLFETIHAEDRDKLKKALETISKKREHTSSIIIRKLVNNQFVWFEYRFFYLADTNGKSIYYAGISDVNEQMESIERLRISEQRFRIAMEASRSTLFELDVKTRVATFAKHTQEEFGLEATVADAPEGFIKQGAIVEGYEDTFREICNKIYQGEHYASCVIQANMRNKEIVWNRITLIAVKNKDNITTSAVGLVENITNEILLGQRMKKENQ